MRVGIGRTGPAGEDITDHVLGKFSAQERKAAKQAVEVAAEAVECCVREGLTQAMNQLKGQPVIASAKAVAAQAKPQ